MTLIAEATIVTIGITFVLIEAIMIDWTKMLNAAELIISDVKTVSDRSKSRLSQSFMAKSAMTEQIMPNKTRISDDFAIIRASSKLFSLKNFAKNRDAPVGTPNVATIVKILASDTTVDAVPMASGEAILVKISHKRYPDIKPPIVSMKM